MEQGKLLPNKGILLNYFFLKSSGQMLNVALVYICSEHVRQRSGTQGSGMVFRGSVNTWKLCLKFVHVYFSILKACRFYQLEEILAPDKDLNSCFRQKDIRKAFLLFMLGVFLYDFLHESILTFMFLLCRYCTDNLFFLF